MEILSNNYCIVGAYTKKSAWLMMMMTVRCVGLKFFPLQKCMYSNVWYGKLIPAVISSSVRFYKYKKVIYNQPFY